jgi:hypothetical protein
LSDLKLPRFAPHLSRSAPDPHEERDEEDLHGGDHRQQHQDAVVDPATIGESTSP